MSLRQSIRHIRRRRQIVAVLVKNGLGYLVQRLGLNNLAPLSDRRSIISCERETDQLLAVRARRALTELGPTFVKLGQLLSTRPDLLPPAYIEQLERLQDRVRPMPEEDLVRQLNNELGPPEQVFAEFDIKPLAAASIGRVHLARLKSGEQVIVKIQRPDIYSQVQNDLEIIAALARIAEHRSETARRIGAVAMIEDYAKMLLRSLDYSREARNTERIYNAFADNENVVIPKVYWEYCTDRILTEEYLVGIKVNNLQELEKRGWNRKKISALGTEAFLTQVMAHGLFQAGYPVLLGVPEALPPDLLVPDGRLGSGRGHRGAEPVPAQGVRLQDVHQVLVDGPSVGKRRKVVQLFLRESLYSLLDRFVCGLVPDD